MTKWTYLIEVDLPHPDQVEQLRQQLRDHAKTHGTTTTRTIRTDAFNALTRATPNPAVTTAQLTTLDT